MNPSSAKPPFIFFFFVSLLVFGFTVSAQNLPYQKPKVYDGIVTQINQADGSFVFRLRDGSLITVKNRIESDAFLSVKGVLNPATGILDKISEIKIKETTDPEKPPLITLMNPGSGQIGTSITLTGTGFLKKNNEISIGSTKSALINLPSPNGKTITFKFPAAPCNQKTKTNCPATVLTSGNYNISVSNKNGLSNAVPFNLTPLPPLAITTDILPQVVGGILYKANISAIGGTESYNWRLTGGQLPSGLLLAQAPCQETPCKTAALVSGIPTIPGIYQFTVTINSGSEIISKQFQITVVQPINSDY